MNNTTRGALLLLSALTLTQCTGKKEEEPAVDSIAVTAAKTGVIQTDFLLKRPANSDLLPGAPLGMYVANYMIDSSGIHVQGATNGVDTGMNILLNDKEDTEETFAVLEQLGIVLQIDVPDMLNRSNDRQQALDAYVDTLSTTYQSSLTQVTALKQKQKNLLAEQHDARTVVTSIQRELNQALQKQDYTSASIKQSEIVEAKAKQSKAEAEVSQINSTITLYINLNKIADKRLVAIRSNREPLIAGLTVVDVPGIKDLGVLEKGNSRETYNTGNPLGN